MTKQSYAIIKEILENNTIPDKIIYNPDLRIYEPLSVIEKRWKDNHEQQKRDICKSKRCHR